MASLQQFFSDDTRLFLFCALLMALYQLFLWKNRKFYSYDREMDRHPLSQKYHLNRTRRADLSRINGLYALANLAAILISSGVMLLSGFETALISLTVLYLILNYAVTALCGRRFGE